MKTLNTNIVKIKDENNNWSSIPALRGESAYELAVKKGFEGSEDDFNNSLVKKEEIDKISETLKGKLNVPLNPLVGKYLRVKAVNEDGVPELEWVDEPSGGSNLDIQIDGESIVQDGVAEIPMIAEEKSGLIQFRRGYGLQLIGNYLLVKGATETEITNRTGNRSPIFANSAFDYAVKAAMCDGKGTAWTSDEQANARERMGINDWEDITDITLEEDSIVDIDLNGEFTDLYLYVDQTNVENKLTGVSYLYPYNNYTNKSVFNSYYDPLSTNFFNIVSLWHYNKNITYRISATVNEQRETTGNIKSSLKAWDKNITVNYPETPFSRIISLTTVYPSGTRIIVKGIRA